MGGHKGYTKWNVTMADYPQTYTTLLSDPATRVVVHERENVKDMECSYDYMNLNGDSAHTPGEHAAEYTSFAKQHCSWKQLPTFTFRNNHKVWFEFVRRTTKDAYAFPSTFDWFITQPKKVINGIFSKFSLKTGAPKEEM